MDMKRILQSINSVKAANAEDTEMKRFVSIINQPAAVDRLPAASTQITESVRTTQLDQYIKSVEQQHLELSQAATTAKLSKAQRLAEHAIAEVGGNHGHFSKLSNHLSRIKTPSDSIVKMAKNGARLDLSMRKRLYKEDAAETDTVTLNVPLLIRLMEFAREEARSDEELHLVVERLIDAADTDRPFTMADYDAIVKDSEMSEDSDPCWKNYKQLGTKKKSGKTVPNCVPKK